MNKRRRIAAIFTTSAVAIVLAACGSGDDSGDFTFTPVPYTVFPEPQCESISCSTSYYLSDDCRWNAADQVQLIVRTEDRNDLVQWMSDQGFVIAEEYNRTDDNTVYMLVAVPRGSVPEAVSRIEDRDGITFVGPNELVFPPESIPQFIQDCRAALETSP